MNNLLTKAQAATHLGVTTRSIEAYAAKGKLTPHKAKGARGDIAVYKIEELNKLKAEREQVQYVNPFLPAQRALQNSRPAQITTPQQQEQPSFLAQMLADPQIKAGLQEFLAEAIQVAAKAAIKAYFQSNADNKLALTLKQASQVSNISVTTLRNDIHEGTLKAKIVGRGWKIRRADLDSYIKRLWEKD